MRSKLSIDEFAQVCIDFSHVDLPLSQARAYSSTRDKMSTDTDYSSQSTEIIPDKFYFSVVRRVDSPQRSTIARANLVFSVDEELVSGECFPSTFHGIVCKFLANYPCRRSTKPFTLISALSTWARSFSSGNVVGTSNSK